MTSTTVKTQDDFDYHHTSWQHTFLMFPQKYETIQFEPLQRFERSIPSIRCIYERFPGASLCMIMIMNSTTRRHQEMGSSLDIVIQVLDDTGLGQGREQAGLNCVVEFSSVSVHRQ